MNQAKINDYKLQGVESENYNSIYLWLRKWQLRAYTDCRCNKYQIISICPLPIYPDLGLAAMIALIVQKQIVQYKSKQINDTSIHQIWGKNKKQ